MDERSSYIIILLFYCEFLIPPITPYLLMSQTAVTTV